MHKGMKIYNTSLVHVTLHTNKNRVSSGRRKLTLLFTTVYPNSGYWKLNLFSPNCPSFLYWKCRGRGGESPEQEMQAGFKRGGGGVRNATKAMDSPTTEKRNMIRQTRNGCHTPPLLTCTLLTASKASQTLAMRAPPHGQSKDEEREITYQKWILFIQSIYDPPKNFKDGNRKKRNYPPNIIILTREPQCVPTPNLSVCLADCTSSVCRAPIRAWAARLS